MSAPVGANPNDARGRVLATPTDVAALRSIAEAGGGSDLSVDDGIGPLRTWIAAGGPSQASATASNANTLAWKEEGPLIALLLLPLAALAFRRRWMMSFMLLPLLLTMQPHDAMASTWDDLWRRPDQQAAGSLSAGDYAKAAQIASDPARRGSAEYKLGDYAKALDAFSQATDRQNDYNRGNALARLGRYPEAVSAYDKALAKDPGDADARANKAAVEALMRKQQDDRQQQQPKPPQQGGQQSQSKQASSGAEGDAKQDASGQGQGRGSSQGGKQAAASGGSSGDQRDAQPSKARPDAEKGGSAKERSASANGTRGAPHDGAAGTADSQGSESPSASPNAKPDDEFGDAARKLAAGDIGRPEGTSAPDAQREAAGDRTQRAGKKPTGSSDATDRAQPLPSEEQVAAEQWLRRIPDDPGGLLRRKFLYQYRQQAQGAPANDQ
jgi:Ca-activated chloride channel family protein